MSAEMFPTRIPVVLGSRSPRRLELLQACLQPDQLHVLPPASPDEQGFEGLTDDLQINQRLFEIVRMKHRCVRELAADGTRFAFNRSPVIIAADTTVVAGPRDGLRQVLGQPDPTHWQIQVRQWFDCWLAGRTHEVRTAVRVSCGAIVREQLVTAAVTFTEVSSEAMDWYLSTGESLGKAGGYAIQGLAAAFVMRLEGCLTTVIGLPLLDTLQLMRSVIEADDKDQS
ncbi:MAG: Maf-like protein YhdE [Planctomycetota bacterium]|jgi:septum formation protein